MAFLSILNLNDYDKLLIIGAPICSMIGSLANWAIMEVDLFEIPKTRDKGKITVGIRNYLEIGYHIKWITLRLLVGGILGLVIAMYFIGIIKDDLNSLTRILAFTIILGYSAPKLMIKQEKMLEKYVDNKFNSINSKK